MHISLIQEYTEGWQKNIPKYNKWTTKQQGWQQKLSFSSSELFLPETNSEKLKSFSSTCVNPSFETCITQRDNFRS